ncbi:MAG: hypothetical protein QXR30_01410 [Candidatus Woesearchaeota archaeon]
MKRRAQIQSQVFIYMLALLGMAVFLVYAYRFILSYQENLYSSELVKFMKDLNFYVNELASSYMTVKTVELYNYPKNYRKICFLDLYNFDFDINNIDDPIIKFIAHQRTTDESHSNGLINVFLVNDLAEFGFFVKNLRVESGYRCIDLKGRALSLKMEGIGRKALLKNS